MTEDNTLLGGYRVLDLTDEKSHLCGKILGFSDDEIAHMIVEGVITTEADGPTSKS